jgi:chromosome segregation ATPase
MIFKSVAPKSKAENISNVHQTKTAPERARLKHFDDQIALAHTVVNELEQRIQRCEQIIQSALENRHALQAAVEADNGKSLSDFSAGLVPDDSAIARLVRASENSGMASSAAKASLPTAQAQLENAKGQVAALQEQRVAEAARVLALLADVDARAYEKAFATLGRLHDRLIGYAAVAEGNQGDVRLRANPAITHAAVVIFSQLIGIAHDNELRSWGCF